MRWFPLCPQVVGLPDATLGLPDPSLLQQGGEQDPSVVLLPHSGGEEQAAVHGLVDTLLSLGLRFVAEGRGGGGLQELGQQLGFAAQHTQRQQQLQGGGGGGGGAAAEARAALAGSRDEPPMQFRPAVHRLATYPVSTAPAHWLQLIVL